MQKTVDIISKTITKPKSWSLRKMDIFGDNLTFNINQNKDYKTKVGGCMTILFLICNVFVFYYFLYKVYDKSDPTIDENLYYNTDVESINLLDYNNQYYFIPRTISNKTYLTKEQFWGSFYIAASLVDNTYSGVSYDQIEVVSCSQQSWMDELEDSYENDLIKNFGICLNIQENKSTISYENESNNIKIVIDLYPCQTNSVSSCTNSITSKDLQLTVNVYEQKFDLTKYYNPSSKYSRNIRNFTPVSSLVAQDFISIHETNLKTDRGWSVKYYETQKILEQSEIKSSIRDSYTDSVDRNLYNQHNTTFNADSWYHLEIIRSLFVKRIHLRYYNLIGALSNIGGITKFITSMIQLVYSGYNIFFLHKEIILSTVISKDVFMTDDYKIKKYYCKLHFKKLIKCFCYCCGIVDKNKMNSKEFNDKMVVLNGAKEIINERFDVKNFVGDSIDFQAIRHLCLKSRHKFLMPQLIMEVYKSQYNPCMTTLKRGNQTIANRNFRESHDLPVFTVEDAIKQLKSMDGQKTEVELNMDEWFLNSLPENIVDNVLNEKEISVAPSNRSEKKKVIPVSKQFMKKNTYAATSNNLVNKLAFLNTGSTPKVTNKLDLLLPNKLLNQTAIIFNDKRRLSNQNQDPLISPSGVEKLDGPKNAIITSVRQGLLNIENKSCCYPNRTNTEKNLGIASFNKKISENFLKVTGNPGIVSGNSINKFGKKRHSMQMIEKSPCRSKAHKQAFEPRRSSYFHIMSQNNLPPVLDDDDNKSVFAPSMDLDNLKDNSNKKVSLSISSQTSMSKSVNFDNNLNGEIMKSSLSSSCERKESSKSNTNKKKVQYDGFIKIPFSSCLKQKNCTKSNKSIEKTKVNYGKTSDKNIAYKLNFIKSLTKRDDQDQNNPLNLDTTEKNNQINSTNFDTTEKNNSQILDSTEKNDKFGTQMENAEVSHNESISLGESSDENCDSELDQNLTTDFHKMKQVSTKYNTSSMKLVQEIDSAEESSLKSVRNYTSAQQMYPNNLLKMNITSTASVNVPGIQTAYNMVSLEMTPNLDFNSTNNGTQKHTQQKTDNNQIKIRLNRKNTIATHSKSLKNNLCKNTSNEIKILDPEIIEVKKSFLKKSFDDDDFSLNQDKLLLDINSHNQRVSSNDSQVKNKLDQNI